MNGQKIEDSSLAHLDTLAIWLDSRFRIPGTNIRFGLDGLFGLVPYIGDITGLLISGIFIRIMLQRGAGTLLMLRMMGNVMFDTIVGVIPLAGDLFDFGYKANRRNLNLLKRYYADGKAKPSAKRSFALLSLLFFAVFILMIWGIWKLSATLITWLWGFF